MFGTGMPTQHRLLVLLFRMRRKIAEKKLKGRETIMWERLKGDKVATLSSKIKMSGYPSISDDANQMWVTMAEIIRKVARETLRVSTRKLRVYKESGWWNEEMKMKIKEKTRDLRSLWLVRRRKIGYKRKRGIKKQNGRQRKQ